MTPPPDTRQCERCGSRNIYSWVVRARRVYGNHTAEVEIFCENGHIIVTYTLPLRDMSYTSEVAQVCPLLRDGEAAPWPLPSGTTVHTPDGGYITQE